MTTDAQGSFNLRRFLLSGAGWPYLLVPFIPIAIVLELAHASATLIFAASALGVIPTAALMGRATEELAARAGPGIGGFLNVTFGNAPELIIAFFALREGLLEVVKASLVGSILGNILLVMGAAMLVGGLKRERQRFDRTAASVQSLMLLLACVALIMPAIFELVIGGGLPTPTEEAEQFPADLERMSVGVAIVLLAIYFAARNKMDLAVNIAIGSSAQIALFAAPVLVLLSFFVGPFPMALVFNGLELGAIVLAILIANQVTQEGESTWFEGLQLLAVYVVLGLVFYYA